MAQSNKVEIILTAKDQISGSIGNIKSSIQSGIGAAVATVATLTAAIGASALALGSLGSGLSTAMDLQTSTISQTYGLATVMGLTVAEAGGAIKSLSKELVTMGDALPGVTEDYSKFAKSLSTSVAFGAKGDLAKYSADIKALSRTGGLLAATSGADAQQGSSALNTFISGGMSLQEAFSSSDLFQKNQDFKAYLAAALKKLQLDGKDFKSGLSNAQRIAAVNLAGTMKFSPEVIEAYGQTADTQLQAIKSKLFNPTTGIFGFSREIKGLDGRTALDAVATLMGQVDKLGTTAGTALAKVGINLDPMLAIGKLSDTLSGWAAAIRLAIGGDGSAVRQMIKGMGDSILAAPQAIADFITDGIGVLLSGAKAGTANSAGNFVGQLFKNIGKAISSINIEGIGSLIGWVMRGLTSAITSINWPRVGAEFAVFIGRIMASADYGAAASLLLEGLKAFFGLLVGALYGAITQLVDIIKSGFSSIFTGISSAFSSAVQAFRQALQDLITGTKRALGLDSSQTYKSSSNEVLPGRSAGTLGTSIPTNPASALPSIVPGSDYLFLPNLNTTPKPPDRSSTFSPVINLTANAGGNLQEMADYMISELDRQYRQYANESIA